MKNVFFALAFMLIGTLAIANTNTETETSFDDVTIENVINIDNTTVDSNDLCGFPVYFDDGGTGDWGGSGSFWMDCDDSTTMGDILDVLLAIFF
ncbi:MAG: hypothetical protein AB8B65_17900 [Kordia sp.]|uniref:hypothetical protein n=1 Tax=Kordia sp. TaxID=1965332 RepID=UPI00385ADA1A